MGSFCAAPQVSAIAARATIPDTSLPSQTLYPSRPTLKGATLETWTATLSSCCRDIRALLI